MRIVDNRETAIPLKSTLANASFDFSEMTSSVVAVITDTIRNGKPVCGFAFNSTGRYASGAQMRARFIPRILAADPALLLDAEGRFDLAEMLAMMMKREKAGGHSERSIAIGTIEVAIWDALAPLHAVLAERYSGGRLPFHARSAMSAAARTGRARPSGTCRMRCGGIWMPATPC
jgi:L-alanine-DL-glutamate epimerase-like enolase superfamily enzyme